jgi:putative MFS transporter
MAQPAISRLKSLPGRTVWQVINDIGMGPWQLRAQLMGGGMHLADGAEIQTVATVTMPLAQELGLSPVQRGALTSIVYLGVLLGGLAAGFAGDVFGRRAPIIVGYAMLAIVAVASAAAGSFAQLVMLRLIFGMFFGVGGPCWNTMAAEITPTSWRIVMAGTSQVYFQIGELYSIFITWWNDPMLIDVDWRWQLGMSALPALVCFFASLAYMDETPGFLAVHGEHDRARQVLEGMRSLNGRPEVDITYDPPPPVQERRPARALAVQLRAVFGGRYLASTLILMWSYVVVNFHFYGNLYVFPQVLPDMADASQGFSPTAQLAFGVLTGEVPGILVASLVGAIMPRRLSIALYLLLQGGASLVFCLHIGVPSLSPLQRGLMTASYITLRFSVNFGFVILWQYTAEVYPTVARATGCAVCFASGRIGAIVAPPYYEKVKDISGGSHTTYFVTCSLLCLVNLMPLGMLEETQGKDLADCLEKAEDEADETTALMGAAAS